MNNRWTKVVQFFPDLFRYGKAKAVRVIRVVWVIKERDWHGVIEKDHGAVGVPIFQVAIALVLFFFHVNMGVFTVSRVG